MNFRRELRSWHKCAITQLAFFSVVPRATATAAQFDSFTPNSNFERLFRSRSLSLWVFALSLFLTLVASWQLGVAVGLAVAATATLNDGRLSTAVEAHSNTCLHFAFRLKNRLKGKCQHGANIDFVYSERGVFRKRGGKNAIDVPYME